MSEERRTNPWNRRLDPACFDPAFILALLYTVMYGLMVLALIFFEVPKSNEKTVDTLFGIMSAIQLAIVGRYFGGSKNAEDAQRLIAQSKEKTDTTLREIIASTMREIIASSAAAAPANKEIKTDGMDVQVSGDVTVNK